MHIGKSGRAVSSICTAEADRIEVRGLDLASELMGCVTFTDYFYLLVTGSMPSENQRFFLDMLLVTMAEHGLVPTVQVARMTLDADPTSLQGAVAAGILGAGPVILGTSILAADLLNKANVRVNAGEEPGAVALSLARDIHAAGGKVPGYGHPLHKPVDPRAARIFSLAKQKRVAGKNVDMAQRLEKACGVAWGKPLVMNAAMATAAVLLDLDMPLSIVKAIPILARTASLLAHLAEEGQNPIGFLMAARAEEAIVYEPAEPVNIAGSKA